MKHLKCLTLLSFILLIAGRGFGQKVKLEEGDLSPLKTEKTLAFAFTYDSMLIGSSGHGHPPGPPHPPGPGHSHGEQTEAEYVAKHTEDYNKKSPGKGDEWAKAWKDDRETLYEPGFIKEFEKYGGLQPDPKSKFTLIFKTTNTEPGFNIGFMRHNAEISGVAWIVETANKSHVIAKISVTNSPGGSFFENDYATDERISTAYSEAGRGLGYFIKGKL
ncbi:MAG TPA: hypothetical protein VGZ90_18860 [Puia sp.]|jgi:hypothetical protein|nr:hypothetical protein [Puia sp.]